MFSLLMPVGRVSRRLIHHSTKKLLRNQGIPQTSDGNREPNLSTNGTGGTGPDLGPTRDAIDFLNQEPASLDNVRLQDKSYYLPTPLVQLAQAQGGGEGAPGTDSPPPDSPKVIGTVNANVRYAVVPPPGESVLLDAAAVDSLLSERAIIAGDLGLSGNGITKLTGTVVNAGSTRLVNVANITATRGALTGELRGALANILNTARAEGVRTLQISASFGNPALEKFAASQAALYGGGYSSVAGQEVFTFILEAP
jgi:hypothetical protein